MSPLDTAAVHRRPQQATRPPPGNGRMRLLVVATIAVGILALMAAAAIGTAHRNLASARSALEAAREAATTRDTERAGAALERARERIEAAGGATRRFPLPLLRAVPALGSPVRALVAVGQAGTEAVEAGEILLAASSDFPTSPSGVGVNSADLSALHAAAVRSQDALTRAEAHLARGGATLAAPVRSMLPPVSRRVRAFAEEIERTSHQLEGVRRGLGLLADLSAPETDTRVLVLAQDSLELRPTGGYIGSYGVLRIVRGTARIEVYAATEDLPPPQPPFEPPPGLAPSLPAFWGLSNVNWWPDFPRTAAIAREMYRRQGGAEVDGVLAMTETATARLIGAIGPLSVPGYERPVTEHGFSERAVYEVELKRPLDEPRKKFLIELANVLFNRLLHLPPEQVPAVAQAVGRSVGAGDIQLWFSDARRQRLIDESVIAGRLPSPAGDFLLVVDANLTASKANLGLRKTIDYRVRPGGDGRLVGDLTVDARNEAPASSINRYYQGLLRIYVPRGSRLLGAGAAHRLEHAADGPFDFFTHRLVVSPGERQVVHFEYELPREIAADGYRLQWLRQAGTPQDSLRAMIGRYPTVADPAQRLLEVTHTVDDGESRGWFRSLWRKVRR